MPGSVQVQRQNCLHLHNMEGSDSCSVTIPLVNTAIRMYGVFDMTLISCVHICPQAFVCGQLRCLGSQIILTCAWG